MAILRNCSNFHWLRLFDLNSEPMKFLKWPHLRRWICQNWFHGKLSGSKNLKFAHCGGFANLRILELSLLKSSKDTYMMFSKSS